jgi:DNA-binding MarR family transcriptional regulator
MNEQENKDILLASLKLSRAMRRCPPDPGKQPLPPAAGRLLESVARHNNVSSRELCEIMDIRPSSLSEMLSRAESEGLITRAADEEDRRIQRVNLSSAGRSFIERMEAARKKDLERKTACFTEEEKAQFCALCDRLSSHLESLALDLPEFPPRPEQPPRRPRKPFPPGGKIRC